MDIGGGVAHGDDQVPPLPRHPLMGRAVLVQHHAGQASHYWHTPEAGGKVDKDNPTQVGRALKQLGFAARDGSPRTNN